MIVQLPKARTGIAEVDRHLALITDKLNPVLRTLALPGGFKWVEIPGQNGGPSTFALQYGGTTVATFTSAGQIVQPAWTPMTLAGTWATDGLLPPAYFRDSLGFVHLRGNVSSGIADLITTLPVGYRPSARAIFATDHFGTYGRVNVFSDGTVTSDIGTNPHTSVALEGVTFDTRS